MPYRFSLANLLILLAACSSAGVAPRDPSSPTPVADPRSGPATVGRGTAARPASGARDESEVPVRAQDAPLVAVRDVLENDDLLGRRVRVSGRCVARGEGRRAGSWTLDQEGLAIEVRGLVPSSCAPERGDELTIFAQIEPAGPGGGKPILLRLPD
ncbi:MAG TPA: hypothetical protein VFH26_05925 [Gemmatimonadales bacterium]|nr:hypothetical protein [Gemmatimonadales bacterium]